MKENSLKNCPLSPKDPEYSQLLSSSKGIHRWKAMEMHSFAEQLTLLDAQMFRLIQPKDVIFYVKKEKRSAPNLGYEYFEKKNEEK